MSAIPKLLRLEFIPTSVDLAVLVLRTALGVQMLMGHGWGKLATFSERAATFPDPLHIGHSTSLALAIVGEVGCSVLICLGLLTRFAAVGSAITMAVAFFLVHHAHLTGENNGEMSFLYMIGYIAILLIGPGRYSLDAKL